MEDLSRWSRPQDEFVDWEAVFRKLSEPILDLNHQPCLLEELLEVYQTPHHGAIGFIEIESSPFC